MYEGITVGVDMGDKKHSICVLGRQGEVLERGLVTNTAKALGTYFGKLEPSRIALETGTHSNWASRLLKELGHEVLVGQPRKLRAIWQSDRKNDQRDAEMLARIARMDPELLYPIHHRSLEAQADLEVMKAREMLVRARGTLIRHVRGVVKAMGGRMGACHAEAFHKRFHEEVPEALKPALEPVIKSIEELSQRIGHYNKLIEDLSVNKYPETQKLREVAGVGPVTALAFVLTLESHERFDKSRTVGAYLGMVPKRDQSGETDKQLRITKAGDVYARSLLVGCSQYILGHFGPDCELRRFGLKLAARGGKNAKRRAVVAVARKLAVLLHALWKSEEPYHPFYQQHLKQAA